MRVKCTAMLLTVYLKSNEITFEVKRPQKLPALESREKNGRGSNSGSSIIICFDTFDHPLCALLSLLSGGLVIQDQTSSSSSSSNLNSLDTKVHHKDEQIKQENNLGPYFGFGVSSAVNLSSTKIFSIVLIFTLFLLRH